jgi:hypothetical protein
VNVPVVKMLDVARVVEIVYGPNLSNISYTFTPELFLKSIYPIVQGPPYVVLWVTVRMLALGLALVTAKVLIPTARVFR